MLKESPEEYGDITDIEFIEPSLSEQFLQSLSYSESITPRYHKLQQFITKLKGRSGETKHKKCSFQDVKCDCNIITHPDVGCTDFELVNSISCQAEDLYHLSACSEDSSKYLLRRRVNKVETDGKLNHNNSFLQRRDMAGQNRNSLQEVVECLRIAISSGDQATARDLATKLAAGTVEVKIDVVPDDHHAERENVFSLRVNVEDRESSGSSITMSVKASDTIVTLKRRMLMKHKFPVDVQRWIIGKRLAKDEETLSWHGVKGAGHSVYLYLVSAKSVGLTREYFQAQFGKNYQNGEGGYLTLPRQQSNMSSANSSLSPRIQDPTFRSPPSRQPSEPVLEEVVSEAATQNQRNITTPLEIQQQQERRSPMVHTEEFEVLSDLGWQCPKCTFINSPTRPGCQMCAASRPPAYKVPEGYVPSEEERIRLEQEVQVEQRTLQAARGERGVDRDRNESERTLHNMIQFNDAMREALNQIQHDKQVQQQPTEDSEEPVPWNTD